MTTPFYAPPDSFHSSRVVFPEAEAQHAAHVLRKQSGDEVVVVDGVGGWHRVQLGHVSRRQVVGHVLETKREVGEPERPVTIGLGVLKKRSRFETFVEKAVELGVSRIQPLRTERTERNAVRQDRLHSVAVAAMKQCQRSRLPRLSDVRSLKAFLKRVAADASSPSHVPHVLLCHEQAADAPPLGAVLQSLDDARPLCILVGPEGGFSEREVSAALEADARLVSLGPRRLRAETAGIVATTLAALVAPV